MKKPSTGFSHRMVHFWHMCQKIFDPISLVCHWCPVLVFFLDVSYLKWFRLAALTLPKKLWHTCVRIVLVCFCVSEILTHKHRPPKFATVFAGPLSLSMSLSICGLLPPLPRSSPRTSSVDVSSHLKHVILPVIPPPSCAHISPLTYRLNHSECWDSSSAPNSLMLDRRISVSHHPWS